MKTRNLIITLSVAALAATNLLANEVVVSPRAKDAPKSVSGTNTDPNQTEYRGASIAPRTAELQTKTVAGKSDKVTPSMKCSQYMTGSPKQIGVCADHPGAAMPCCSAGEKK